MKFLFFLVSNFLIYHISLGCSCSPPDLNLEFYASKYVFSGEITSKNYSQDSLTYEITFRVDQHFKEGDNPPELKFTKTSEGKFIGVVTSCDESYHVGEKWLVFSRMNNGKLVFSANCSNTVKGLGSHLNGALKRAKELDISKHFFAYELSGLFPKNMEPLTNVDSLISNAGIKGSTFLIARFLVDRSGRSIDFNLYGQNLQKLTNKNASADGRGSPLQDLTILQKQIWSVCENIKSWHLAALTPNEERVNTIRYLVFSNDSQQKIKWRLFHLNLFLE